MKTTTQTDEPDKERRCYKSRIETLAVREEIVRDLSRGYPVTEIYRSLKRRGKISVGLRQFLRAVRNYVDHRPSVFRPRASKVDNDITRPQGLGSAGGIGGTIEDDPDSDDPEFYGKSASAANTGNWGKV